MSDTLTLAKALIERPSVTPDDAGCQALLQERLNALGFKCHTIESNGVTNLWACLGTEGPLFTFLGHTDVVPAGDLEAWTSHPFEPTIRDNKLYGRGAADMKSSIAAMITAVERVLSTAPKLKSRISFLITSDEEGPATDGTVKVLEYLNDQNTKIDWCLVGEPSSTHWTGDIIKHGRRGSLSGKLTVHGTQGHVAYPHLADNPIHKAFPALQALTSEVWDKGNDHFPATSFQISNIQAGTGANNVIPGNLHVDFNFRFCTELTDAEIRTRVEKILNDHQLEYSLDWRLSGQPFITAAGALLEACQHAVEQITGKATQPATTGGTSDGRFVAPTGAQVVELGPINATIHQVDEHIDLDGLEQLTRMYEACLKQLCV